jgi:hypothetical protein
VLAATWLVAGFTGLAVVAAIGGGVALSQLRQQAKVIRGELERNKKRDELIDRQLREVEQRTRIIERSQAEQVVFVQSTATGSQSGPSDQAGTRIHTAQVENHPSRPIRNVVCRIRPSPEQQYNWEAGEVGELSRVDMPFGRGPSRVYSPVSTSRVAVMRSGEVQLFRFPIPVAEHEGAQVKVRFTDDAWLGLADRS